MLEFGAKLNWAFFVSFLLLPSSSSLLWECLLCFALTDDEHDLVYQEIHTAEQQNFVAEYFYFAYFLDFRNLFHLITGTDLGPIHSRYSGVVVKWTATFSKFSSLTVDCKMHCRPQIIDLKESTDWNKNAHQKHM